MKMHFLLFIYLFHLFIYFMLFLFIYLFIYAKNIVGSVKVPKVYGSVLQQKEIGECWDCL